MKFEKHVVNYKKGYINAVHKVIGLIERHKCVLFNNPST